MDESLFDYVGWVCTQWGVPFRDAADHDFPGMFFLHALARFLFQSPMWSFRSFDYLLLLAFCGLVYRGLCRFHDRLTALIFVPLYQIMYVTAGFWMSGQRDLIGVHLMLSAGLLFLERVRGGGRPASGRRRPWPGRRCWSSRPSGSTCRSSCSSTWRLEAARIVRS